MGYDEAEVEGALRVLLVDSRPERRKLMIDVVQGDGGGAVVVAEADGLGAALVAIEEEGADALLLDLRMPTVVGVHTVRVLRSTFPDLAIVVCSFDLDAPTIREALTAGAAACLRKPASPHELVVALETARRCRAGAPDALVATATE